MPVPHNRCRGTRFRERCVKSLVFMMFFLEPVETRDRLGLESAVRYEPTVPQLRLSHPRVWAGPVDLQRPCPFFVTSRGGVQCQRRPRCPLRARSGLFYSVAGVPRCLQQTGCLQQTAVWAEADLLRDFSCASQFALSRGSFRLFYLLRHVHAVARGEDLCKLKDDMRIGRSALRGDVWVAMLATL